MSQKKRNTMTYNDIQPRGQFKTCQYTGLTCHFCFSDLLRLEWPDNFQCRSGLGKTWKAHTSLLGAQIAATFWKSNFVKSIKNLNTCTLDKKKLTSENWFHRYVHKCKKNNVCIYRCLLQHRFMSITKNQKHPPRGDQWNNLHHPSDRQQQRFKKWGT